MLITATVDQHRLAPVDRAAAFALLADVPRSVQHFPDVESVRPVGEVWQWRLRELGAGPLRFQVAYASRYLIDTTALRVAWARVPGFGNTAVDGEWRLEPEPGGTRIRMVARFEIDTPFPRLTRAAVEAVVAHENTRLIGAYIDNLITTLRGGDGRARR